MSLKPLKTLIIDITLSDDTGVNVEAVLRGAVIGELGAWVGGDYSADPKLARILGPGASYLYVADVGVEKKYRRRGIGRAMYQALFKEAARLRLPVVSANLANSTLSWSAERVWVSLTMTGDYNIVVTDPIMDKDGDIRMGFVVLPPSHSR